MPSKGYLQVQTYTSNARIPLRDTAVAITDENGKTIALRLTNQSGQLDEPIEITVPDLSASQSPNTGTTPYAVVNIYAKAKDYEEIEVENVQIFPDTATMQELALIPLAELPDYWNQVEIFNTPKQNL